MAKPSTPSILLVDDSADVLNGLKTALSNLLEQAVEIRTWRPSAGDGDPLEKLEEYIDDETVFVATDYDLTSGMLGLFGLTIVAWCQQRSIPVGDFSRGNLTALPKEPNLFELRIPPSEDDAANFIASAFEGFHGIRKSLETDPASFEKKRSPAAVLAAVLGKPQIESQFALYMARLGAANSSLIEKLKQFAGEEQPSQTEKRRLLTYVLGHVLINAVLKYPGPILSERALCAYLATSESEKDALDDIFDPAWYNGPFARNTIYYWRDAVDGLLDGMGSAVEDEQFEMFADFNRRVVEKKLGRSLANHDCDRCGGNRGGFLCPFTQRPVCLRADCSVSASSWIPQGAQLCRVEKNFYDEWAPLLGL